MISLRATLPVQAPPSGKSGAPFLASVAETGSSETKGVNAGSFASLLDTGSAGGSAGENAGANTDGGTDLAAQLPNALILPQDGNILPDGNLPGKVLPLGTDLPIAAEIADLAAPETATDQPAEARAFEGIPVPPQIPTIPATASALPVPETKQGQTSPASPAKAADEAALAKGAQPSVDPAAALRPQPALPAEGTRPVPQAVHGAAVLAVQPVPQVKSGTPSVRQPVGGAERSASPASITPTAQIISTVSTRDALDMPRAMLPAAINTAPLPVGDPVVATGHPASGISLAAPSTMPQPPIAPHDFEALIDRLSQARETAQPGAARLALPHSEFGQVNLRFDASASSMTVTMTSHDPDFALAARTALAERATLAPEQTRSDANTGRNDPGNTGNGQAQGQTNGQMQGQPRPANNHAAPSSEHGPAADPGHPASDQAANRSGGNRALYA